jgi:hypothetical protein
MSDLEPRQWISAETPEGELLDGMDIYFAHTARSFLEGDAITVKHGKSKDAQTTYLHVVRPEDTGAIVSCNIPPMFWTLHFHLDHIEQRHYRLRMEKHHVDMLEHIFDRKFKKES